MAKSLIEVTPLIARMTSEDRQEINRIIEHKRKEFEGAIQKGVVAMLNAQEEHDKLAEKRAEYLSFLSSSTLRRKEKLTYASDVSKEATRSAPLGIGSAAQIVLSAGNALGNTVLDDIEEKRQQVEAEQNLYSAQMMYYIPPQDYEMIAERIAGILSYRYQFLILRLAAGENGYIKLALFMISSMKSNAIACLREQKNNVISALINAAIPASTDSLSYREWPNIDFANFRMQASQCGSRKILELDPNVNRLVQRCGPAVRALLGGYETYVEPEHGIVRKYHAYTIIGALNHAPILNSEKRIISGIQTRHRNLTSLDGNMKYPMILLSANETTANLGVNFATISTNQTLEELHVVVLKRLVPDFFTHHLSYKLQTEKATGVLRHENIRYSEERFECPWTMKRERQWESRLQKIYQASDRSPPVDSTGDIECPGKLTALEVAGHEFNLEAQKIEVVQIERDITDSIQQIVINSSMTSPSKVHQINAMDQSRYGLLAIKGWIAFMLRFRQVSQADFLKVKRVLEVAHLTIYAARGNPLLEAENHHKVMQAKARAQSANDVIAKVHKLAISNYRVILDLVNDTSVIEVANEVLARDNRLTSHAVKNLKMRINDNLRALQKMQDVSVSFASYDPDIADVTLSVEQAITEFEVEVQELRNCLDDGQSVHDMLQCIQYCKQDVKHYYELMMLALQSRDCWFEAKDCWAAGVNLEGLSAEERNAILIARIEKLYADVQVNVIDALGLSENAVWWSIFSTHPQADMTQIKVEAIQRKAIIFEIYQCMSYKKPSVLIEADQTTTDFFLRARYQSDLSWLCSVNKDNPERLAKILVKAKQLHSTFQKIRAEKAVEVCSEMKRRYARIPREISWVEIKDIAHIVRLAKETLELDIRDDVELIELALNHTLYIERESSQMLQDILAVDSKLQYIKEHFCASTPKDPSVNYMGLVSSKLELFDENISLAGSGDQDHMSYMSEQYKRFLADCDGKEHPEICRFGVIFLSQMMEYINNHYIETLELNKLVGNLSEDRGLISMVIHQEPLEYLVARKKSLKALQGAYQHIHALNDLMQKNSLGTEHPRHIREMSSVANTLMWSSTLSVAEQKWLDARISNKLKVSFTDVRDYKAPCRMAYSFVLALIMDGVSQKTGELTRVKQIQKQLSKPKSISMFAGGLGGSPVESRSSLAKRTSNLRLKIEAEVDNLKLFRDVVFAQSLKIFFNEWKIKSFGEDKSSKVISFISRMPLAARMQITGSEQSERFSEHEEDDDQDSIDDLEVTFAESIKF